MRISKSVAASAAALALLTGGPVRGVTLIGTQVTGELYFPGYPQNFFNPVNGRVPAGYLNVGGTNVTISSTAVEFGFSDPTAIITADFTGTQLTVTETPQFSNHYNSLQLIFADSAFTNVATVSDSFPNGGLIPSVSGDVITLDWPGGDLVSSVGVQAVFDINSSSSSRLSIQLGATHTVVLSWPVSTPAFTLQQNNGFSPLNWGNVTNTPAIVNGQNQVIVSPSSATRFYRLKL